ncbi:MAG: hypothetical protein K8S16_08685, partial [Bacteroidales bacterium]|nr:hypothetical protein [Bacteroidales bacterium]
FVPVDYDPSLYNQTREERIESLRNLPTHLCRLRYKVDEEKWTLAYYSYTHEKYESCVFDNGDFYGTPEEAFQSSAIILDD